MHFRTLCPSVMLASFHSGVVTSPFKVDTAVEMGEKTIFGRDGSCCNPRESDEEKKLASFDTDKMEEVGDEEKENYNSRDATGFFVRRNSVSNPIEIKRKVIEPINTLRRTPGMGFSLFSRGIPFVDPLPKKSPPKSPTPPPPQISIRLQKRTSPPLSPLITPPEARICGGWPQKGSGMRRIPTTPISGRRSMRREYQQQGKLRSSLPMRITKSNVTMNPNQRFALVCRNDRFYWVSKEIDGFDRY